VLVNSTIAMSVAVVLVRLLRPPARRVAGPGIAYWLWLLVPAMAVAVLLPAPRGVCFIRAVVLPNHVGAAINAAVSRRVPDIDPTPLVDLALAVWTSGFLMACILTVRRRRQLAPDLGELIRDPRGFHRGRVNTPMVVGALHPRIVVPLDFESRYADDEQELILAHERAHISRRDVAINTLATLVLCIHWFNPLIYAALVWLRMDQELACDAEVLRDRGYARRRYAQALLDTQLATQSAWRLPTGCHWQSIHPLKERVAMLARPLPPRSRRLATLAFITAVLAGVTYTAWAAQPLLPPGPKILIGLDMRISNEEAHTQQEYATMYIVHSGETIKDKSGEPLLHMDRFAFACTPYLPDAPGQSTDWSDLLARGAPLPAAGEILLDCTIERDGQLVQRPAVITKDGESATIGVTDSTGTYHFNLRIEVTASETRAEEIMQSSMLHN